MEPIIRLLIAELLRFFLGSMQTAQQELPIQSQSSIVSVMKSCQKIKMRKLILEYNSCKGIAKSKKKGKNPVIRE